MTVLIFLYQPDQATIVMENIVNHKQEDSILEKMHVSGGQKKARESSNNIKYVSNLNMYSASNKMRLSGVVCTIGPVSRSLHLSSPGAH